MSKWWYVTQTWKARTKKRSTGGGTLPLTISMTFRKMRQFLSKLSQLFNFFKYEWHLVLWFVLSIKNYLIFGWGHSVERNRYFQIGLTSREVILFDANMINNTIKIFRLPNLFYFHGVVTQKLVTCQNF